MTIKEEAIEVLVEKAAALFGVSKDTLGENTSFRDDLGCKSTNIVQFSAALEDHFDIEVPYMELARRKTFGEAGDLMEELFA